MTLEEIATFIVADGKGILAADESNPTCGKRFDSIGVESTEENRRDYREMLFRSKGMKGNIGGVILFDETIRQKMPDGRAIPDALTSLGVYPGIKVDTGAKNLANHEGEKITEGLDGLSDRCEEYFSMGARFAKWRAVIQIGDGKPSDACISTNAHALARYASICQEQGLVPIIEPEVVMAGDHDADTCYEVTSSILEATFEECRIQGVHIPGALLKPNMIIAGNSCSKQISRKKVAQMTVDCLTEQVPHNLPGIVFLSGGQSDEDATAHLNLMNAMDIDHPWQLSYSFGRALLANALKTWATGDNEGSQSVFLHRSKMNSLARTGDWSSELEHK